MTKISNEKFMTVEEVSEAVCMGRTTIYNHVKNGKFPPPYKIGARISRWKSTEVNYWMNSLKKKKNGDSE